MKCTSIYDANDACYSRLYLEEGGEHSIRILDTTMNESELTAMETTEKDGYTGIYRYIYPDCRSVDLENIYKKK